MTFKVYNIRGKRFLFYFLFYSTHIKKLYFFFYSELTFIFFASVRLVVPHTINKSGYSGFNKDEVCKNNAEL